MSEGVFDKLKRDLSDFAPIASSEEEFTFAPPGVTPETIVTRRLSSRDRHTNVTFRPDAIAIETTSYSTWSELRSLLVAVLEARTKYSPLDGLIRVGLRMIDEVRVGSAFQDQWGSWVHSSLLGPHELINELGYLVVRQQGVVQVQPGQEGRSLTFRYGPGEGQAVVDSASLVRPADDRQGPFFLLDFDSVWEPSNSSIPELTVPFVQTVVDDLHAESKNLFEKSITERLRTEVLNAR